MARINYAHFHHDPEPPQRRAEKKPAYISWLHNLCCSATGREDDLQAAHVSYAMPWYGHWGRAKGTKAPDLFALPLCREEHFRQHSMGESAYWLSLGIDPHLLGLTLFGIYSSYDEAISIERAKSRIISGLAATGRLPKSRDEA